MSAVHTERLATRDVDVARDGVGNLFCAHTLEPCAGADSVNLTLRAARLGGIAIVEMDYGATVEIRPEALSTFYLVQVPIRGSAQIFQRRRQLDSDPATASVLSPLDPVRMLWRAGNPQLVVYLDRAIVEAELTRILGRPPAAPPVFELAMATGTRPARSWLRTVRFLWDEVARQSALLTQPETVDALARALTLQLLETQPHTYSEGLSRLGQVPVSTARRAAEFIETNLQEPLSVSRVASEFGIGTRSLQEAFRRELDTTPATFVKDLRLARAREVLRRSEPGSTTVTDVAMRLGIMHLGRFSVEYRRRYDESPSATLRRRP